MSTFNNQLKADYSYNLWTKAKKERTREESERLLVNEYHRLFQIASRLDVDNASLKAENARLKAENEFMIRFINRAINIDLWV